MQKNLSKLRIIGGKWRSRKIDFLPLKGVRPTTDMVRETLFNWLTPFVDGARCLDLFAGSGALGFEALSRGASCVVMIDASVKMVAKLRENGRLLQADNAEFYVGNLPERIIKIPRQQFDIVFIDPPFNQNLVAPTCNSLIENDLLAENARIYIESEKRLDIEAIVPNNWKILRDKRSGPLISCLLQA